MEKTLLDKIGALNQAVLDSVGSASEKRIVERLIQAGIEVLGADYGYCFF